MGWELIGEIRLGMDLSFDEAVEAEERLREGLAALLAPCDVPWLDIKATGDGISFTCSPKEGGAEEIRAVCLGLCAILDPGGQGRIVAACDCFGPVLVHVFSANGLEPVQRMG